MNQRKKLIKVSSKDGEGDRPDVVKKKKNKKKIL